MQPSQGNSPNIANKNLWRMLSLMHPTYVGKSLIKTWRGSIVHSSRKHMTTTRPRRRQESVEILLSWWRGCFSENSGMQEWERRQHVSLDLNMRLVQNLWHIIQSHTVMTKFTVEQFHRHIYKEPSVVNPIFDHNTEKLMCEFSRRKFWEKITSLPNR